MVMSFAPFDVMGRSRISQLVNKSNQFNLTRRYTEAERAELAADPSALTLQVRLRDRFGDSGMIAVLIARRSEHQGEPAVDIDTWLMSCRVLGRKVEEVMARTGLGGACSLAEVDRRPVHSHREEWHGEGALMRSLASKPVRSQRKARPATRIGCSMSRPIKRPNCR